MIIIMIIIVVTQSMFKLGPLDFAWKIDDDDNNDDGDIAISLSTYSLAIFLLIFC